MTKIMKRKIPLFFPEFNINPLDISDFLLRLEEKKIDVRVESRSHEGGKRIPTKELVRELTTYGKKITGYTLKGERVLVELNTTRQGNAIIGYIETENNFEGGYEAAKIQELLGEMYQPFELEKIREGDTTILRPKYRSNINKKAA